ncbi:unnamed protein product, partial [Discosporangium mesarthrocarpum]
GDSGLPGLQENQDRAGKEEQEEADGVAAEVDVNSLVLSELPSKVSAVSPVLAVPAEEPGSREEGLEESSGRAGEGPGERKRARVSEGAAPAVSGACSGGAAAGVASSVITGAVSTGSEQGRASMPAATLRETLQGIPPIVPGRKVLGRGGRDGR